MPAAACAYTVYPILVAQIVRPSIIAQGVSPALNPRNLTIVSNACPAPVETTAQAQQQIVNQTYMTPATDFTLTLLGG
jgi:hypothetical protein